MPFAPWDTPTHEYGFTTSGTSEREISEMEIINVGHSGTRRDLAIEIIRLRRLLDMKYLNVSEKS